VIIEVNAGPGLQMHTAPETGTPRPVAEAIIETLFPAGQTGRIPLVAVVGAGETADIAELVARGLAQAGLNVGLATAERAMAGATQIGAGDSRTAEMARRILLNPLVEAAVFETSLERICDEGLGFDRCQVAVVVGVGEGIRLDVAAWDTLDKQTLVHRTVSDVVLPDGYLVMQAGEPLGSLISEKCDGKRILVALDETEADLREHLAAGGRGVVGRGAAVALLEGSAAIEIAIKAPPSIARLAALAALWALGLEPGQILAAAS